MALALILILIAAGAILTVVQRQLAKSDSKSVEAHHQILDRLQQMTLPNQQAHETGPSEHGGSTVPPHVRVVPSAPSARPQTASSSVMRPRPVGRPITSPAARVRAESVARLPGPEPSAPDASAAVAGATKPDAPAAAAPDAPAAVAPKGGRAGSGAKGRSGRKAGAGPTGAATAADANAAPVTEPPPAAPAVEPAPVPAETVAHEQFVIDLPDDSEIRVLGPVEATSGNARDYRAPEDDVESLTPPEPVTAAMAVVEPVNKRIEEVAAPPTAVTPSKVAPGALAPVGLGLIGSPPRRSRPDSRRYLVPASIAAAVVIIGVAAGLALARGDHGKGHTPTAAAASPTTIAPPPVTTTLPARTSPVATSTSSTGVTYLVSSAAVTLRLEASTRCWLELRSGSANGPVLYEGVLAPGAAQVFNYDQALWLRLGYPAGVTLQLNGSTVTLPSNGSPYNVSVQNASGAT